MCTITGKWIEQWNIHVLFFSNEKENKLIWSCSRGQNLVFSQDIFTFLFWGTPCGAGNYSLLWRIWKIMRCQALNPVPHTCRARTMLLGFFLSAPPPLHPTPGALSCWVIFQTPPHDSLNMIPIRFDKSGGRRDRIRLAFSLLNSIQTRSSKGLSFGCWSKPRLKPQHWQDGTGLVWKQKAEKGSTLL